MLNKLCFAWVAEDEEFDSQKHGKKDLVILKAELEHKEDGYAKAKLLIKEEAAKELLGSKADKKFAMLSLNQHLLFKGQRISLNYDKLSDIKGYVLELHAKPSNCDGAMDEVRQQYALDSRFLRQDRYSKLIDKFISFDRFSLKPEVSADLDASYVKDSRDKTVSEITTFFPETVREYQKNPGVSHLNVQLNLQWLLQQQGFGVLELGNIMQTSGNQPSWKLAGKFMPGTQKGPYMIRDCSEHDVQVSWLMKCAREECINLKLETCLDEALCDSKKEEVKLYVGLDEYLDDCKVWKKNEDYYVDDEVFIYGKKYLCLQDHCSYSWFADKDKWKLIDKKEKAVRSSVSVACESYGQNLLKKCFEILKPVILHTNRALRKKINLPIEQMLDLKVGQFVKFKEEIGLLKKWKVCLGSRCYGEVSVDYQLPKKQVQLSDSGISEYAAEEYFEEGVIQAKSFEHCGFVYTDCSDQFPKRIQELVNKYSSKPMVRYVSNGKMFLNWKVLNEKNTIDVECVCQ